MLRAVYQAAHMKQRHGWTNESMDDFWENKRSEGFGRVQFPQKWSTIRSALESPSIEESEYHVCHLCGRVFDWCARNDYARHAHHRCPMDGTPRFERGGVGQLVPRRKVWLRSLRDIIQSFLLEPRMLAQLGAARESVSHDAAHDAVGDAGAATRDRRPGFIGPLQPEPAAATSIWESPYIKWLDMICNRVISRPRAEEMAMLFVLGACPTGWVP